jgi:hypothetical protein
MTRSGAAWVLATACVAATSWLWLGTQQSLPTLTRGAEDWSGDFRSYYLPNAEFAAARLAEFSLPLWNPHQGAGTPFLASIQPGVLYPPNALHVLLPSTLSFLVLIALHLAFAVGTAALLARHLGATPAGAAVAGLAYATSFQVIGSAWTPPLVYTAAWMPCVVWAADRVCDRATVGRVAMLAVSTGLPALAGWPYAVALTAMTCALMCLGRLLARAFAQRSLDWRTVLALAIGAGIGVMMAAPQLLPSGELVARSCRSLGSIIEEQAVFVPQPHDPRIFLQSTLSRGFNDGVPGYPALLLAPLALLLPGRRRARVGLLMTVGLLGLLTSFPSSTPLYGWIRELPVMGDFRFPYRYRMLPNLALAIAAGVGVARLQARVTRWPRAPQAVAALALAATLVFGSLPVLRAASPFARELPPAVSLEQQIAALGVDWRPQPYERVYWTGRSHKLRNAGDAFAVHDMEPLTLATTAQLLTFFETGRPLTLLTLNPPKGPRKKHRDWVAAPFFGWLNLPGDSQRAAILDLFSVGTIIGRAPPVWLAERYERISPDGAPEAVFRNPHALPRAYRVGVAIPEPASIAAAAKRMTAPGFDPRSAVLLDEPPARFRPRGRPPRPSAGAVEIAEYSGERIVLNTRGPRPALVVLTDAWFPGWRARVDGTPSRLHRANANFRAVAVDAGPHTVVMEYQPDSLLRGWGLAAVGGLVLLGAVAASRRGQLLGGGKSASIRSSASSGS